ncbi:hypothetical protein NQ314_011181 [Rhamnusium bicolor]|uniref:Uncharacterized protein n=1 Tax=Rhamnusium bicolor TaxID=1586634 RepID=A0AAV8XL29_9CUCU|nr:hypothetical protein NQ314_011181 [Rhamnusium bicolor]
MQENPVTWNEFADISVIHGKHYPIENSLWYTFVIFTTNTLVYRLLKILLHILPALVFDVVAVILGNKPR